MSQQYLTLGLFVVLLSFFMVLNSISSFEDEKTRSVIDSLSVALVPQYAPVDRAKSVHLSQEGVGRGQGDVLDQIEGVFRSIIPDIYAQKNRFGDLLRVELSVEEFEAVLKQQGRGQEQERFSLMLSALMSLPDQRPYQMDVLYHLDESPSRYSAEDPDAMDSHIRRISGYMKTLQEAGVSPSFMSVGFVKGGEGTVSLVFRPFVPLRLEASSLEVSP